MAAFDSNQFKRNNQTWHILEKTHHLFLQKKRKLKDSSHPPKSFLSSSAHIFINDQMPVDESSSALLGELKSPKHFRPCSSAVSVTLLPSNRNLQVKTNIWQHAIIGTNWTELYIQICCLLSTSWHINSLSSGCLALSDVGANELVSAVCQRQKWENGRGEVKIVFPFCNYFQKVL